ncbi:MAG: dehydrogenase E1 component subunit alpha/beta [Bacteroidia bacterium]|nr:dehydrogenase E1 component subunit alpha/beta [Bacteroidia bacterium]MBP9178949.1 dehydrogenase E1 component subunit alpha/beta [Bacteroidia bacterium]MBP9723250.1 dehydrogenase E1 component subunit alpha/beta [Bacteroidia bacterium]
MDFQKKYYDNELLLRLYKGILKPRMIEEKMLILLRQGKVSKWFSGIGQEAISAGATLALEKEEYILPLHRNLGVFTNRDIPLTKLLAQWQGKFSGFSKGRERSFHFGTNEYHIVGMISHLGAMLGVADGIALAGLLKEEKKVALVFSGDGGASEGDFHEALNTAAVWELPVIFLVENNGYGLSTPSNEQFRCKRFIDKGIGYGMEVSQVDGNNVLAVYDAVKNLAVSMRHKPRPVLLECMTFRMRGHEEASGTKYVPQELFDEWGKKDPLSNFEAYLLEQNILTPELIETYRNEIKNEIDHAVEEVFAQPDIIPDTAYEMADVYAPHVQVVSEPATDKKSPKRLIDAVSDGLRQAMEKHNNLVLMGQDIAEYGGVFKATQGFVEQFGKGRVRNTPLCESAIIGSAYGLSIKGMKAMVEMQFADFVTCGFNQIINNLAKSHYRWAQPADVVVRMPTGAGVGAGPFHSQSNEAWFFHTPGLKVLYPSTPSDAKGLLLAAFEDPNPVLFFEHKAMYRSFEEDVFDDYYTIEIGKAKTVKEGNEVSIITYGAAVHWAMEVCKELSIDADIIDLRSLLPWDKTAVEASVNKTGKAIVFHEDCETGGIGAEIAAHIGKHCFKKLDAPVYRTGSLDTPVPFAVSLEQNFLPKERFKKDLLELMSF